MTLSEARNELKTALVRGEGYLACPIIPLRLIELVDGYLVAGINDPPIHKSKAVSRWIKPLERTWNGKFITYQQTAAPWYGRRFAKSQLELIDGLIDAIEGN